MINKTIITILIIIGWLSFISVYLFVFKTDKIAYVDVVKTYNDFKLQKELTIKYSEIEKAKERIKDSLKVNLNLLLKQIEREEKKNKENVLKYNNLLDQYYAKENQFNEENETLSKKYTEQIWLQLNQYILDYGEKNHFKMILGANGQGNVMYSDKENDITEKILNYVNERYEGENK